MIVKHNNPCGVAVAGDVGTAYDAGPRLRPGVGLRRRDRGQPRRWTRSSARCWRRRSSRCCWRPATTPTALEALTRKPNIRIMLENRERRRRTPGERDLRRVSGGLLVQDRDAESEDREHMTVVTEAPADARREWGDLLFAWRVAKHVKSNAIVLARDLATVGIGAGQMSRVDSVRLVAGEGPGRRSTRLGARPATRSSPSPTAREAAVDGRRDRASSSPAARSATTRCSPRATPRAWRWSSPAAATSATS